MRMGLSADAPVALTETNLAFGASWGADGTILYGQPDGIWQVRESGGTPERVIETEAGEPGVRPPGGCLTATGSCSRWLVGLE